MSGDPLVTQTAGMLQGIQETLRIQRRRARPDTIIFDEWRERLLRLTDEVNGLPMDDPGRGAALSNLLACEEALAEVIAMASQDDGKERT